MVNALTAGLKARGLPRDNPVAKRRQFPKQLERDRNMQQALIQAKSYSHQDHVYDQLYDRGRQVADQYQAIISEQMHLDRQPPDVQDAIMKINAIFRQKPAPG